MTTPPAPWKQRLDAVTAERGRLCVGIDPMPAVLQSWGLDLTVAALESCSRGIVEELADEVAVFKPQSAFFEAFGSAGVAVLERVLADIRDAGALSLLDVKRGDIGSSMGGYATAYLSDESPLRADAITVSPYLGVGALQPAIDLAVATGRGVYVLARTSNPDGVAIQTARIGTDTVAQHVVDTVAELNPLSDHALGLVVGATHADLGCDPSRFNGSLLVPGIGAQGGTIADVLQTFGSAARLVLPTASREVIGAGRCELTDRAARLLEQASRLP